MSIGKNVLECIPSGPDSLWQDSRSHVFLAFALPGSCAWFWYCFQPQWGHQPWSQAEARPGFLLSTEKGSERFAVSGWTQCPVRSSVLETGSEELHATYEVWDFHSAYLQLKSRDAACYLQDRYSRNSKDSQTCLLSKLSISFNLYHIPKFITSQDVCPE